MKIKYYTVVFFFFVLLVSCVVFLHQAIAKELSVESKNYHKHEIHIEMPNIENHSLKHIVSEKLEQLKSDFLKEIEGVFSQDKITYTLDISSQMFSAQSYISYAFFIEEYTGGAHPNHTMWTIVYDTSQNEVITLEKLIRSHPHFLESVSRQVISELLYNPRIVDVTMLMEGARPILSNYQNFVLTNKGILFYFIPYQIAPYSSGSFEVLVENV